MKRLLCGLSIIIFVLVMISPAAYAAVPSEVYAQVEAANQAIEARIKQAQDQARDIWHPDNYSGINGQERKAQREEALDGIIQSLLDDTNLTAAETKAAAEAYNVKVICTWTKVQIGNRWVMVDPLIVCDE